MDEKISPEAEERIRELCRKITVAHNLDEEIQQELYSHMEDRLLGYLSGSEKVTEEDAFVLVREHFGDPEVIKTLLQETHAVESDLSLLRRLGAVAVASLAVLLIIHAFWVVLRYSLPDRPSWITDSIIVQSIVGFMHQFGPVLLLGIVLGVWRKMTATGRLLWFSTLDAKHFIMIMAGLVLLMVFLLLTFKKAEPEWERLALQAAHTGYMGISYKWLSFILQCMLWIWWTDTKPRRLRTMIIGALGWAGFFYAYALIGTIGSDYSEIFEHSYFYLLGIPMTAVFDAIIAILLYLMLRPLVSLFARRMDITTR